MINKMCGKAGSGRFLAFFLVFILFSFAGLPAYCAASSGLMPHKAMYSVQMISKKSGAQVANIHGDMVYELQPSCDAWITNQSFTMTYEYYESPATTLISDFSTYESFDGKTLNFSVQRKSGVETVGEFRGTAAIKAGKESRAIYSIPPDLKFDLAGGTLFPVAHTKGVLDSIRQNKKFYAATLFDGSDDEGPVEVNTVIGKKLDMGAYVKDFKDIKSELLSSQAWKLRLAFFPADQSEGESDYEISAVFHENGLISDMIIDYDDFSVRQKLVALEPLEDTCNSEDGKKEQKNPVLQ